MCATVRRPGDEVTSKRPCGAGDRPLGAPRPHLPGSKHPLRSGAVGGPALCLDTPVGSTPVVGRGSSVSLGAQASWVASWGGPGQEGWQPRPWAAGLPPTEDSASGGPGSFPAALWPGAADRARGMLPRAPAGRPGLGLWAEQAPSPGAAIPVPGVPPLCPWPRARLAGARFPRWTCRVSPPRCPRGHTGSPHVILRRELGAPRRQPDWLSPGSRGRPGAATRPRERAPPSSSCGSSPRPPLCPPTGRPVS